MVMIVAKRNRTKG